MQRYGHRRGRREQLSQDGTPWDSAFENQAGSRAAHSWLPGWGPILGSVTAKRRALVAGAAALVLLVVEIGGLVASGRHDHGRPGMRFRVPNGPQFGGPAGPGVGPMPVGPGRRRMNPQPFGPQNPTGPPATQAPATQAPTTTTTTPPTAPPTTA